MLVFDKDSLRKFWKEERSKLSLSKNVDIQRLITVIDFLVMVLAGKECLEKGIDTNKINLENSNVVTALCNLFSEEYEQKECDGDRKDWE